ncbi:MAG: tripartite tricarboxylate transporter substrate-binding protein [Pseudomonadota bacterium]
MTTSRRTVLAAGASLAAASIGMPRWAGAQAPQRPVKIIIGFAAGGGTDALARALADALKPHFPAGVVVDNRTGASGRLAVQAVKGAEPDGTTLLFTPDFCLTVYPHTFSRLGYDPVADLAPVALAAKSGYVLSAGPMVPATVKDAKDYLALARSNPGMASYGSSGAGTTLHFAGAMLEHASGVKLTHVPYKGGALSLQDLMGGQIPVSINAVGEVLPHLSGGRLRALATFGDKRNPFMPNAPTMVESGFKDVVSEAWLGFFLPPRTPADIVARTAVAINQVTSTQELRERFARFGMEPQTGNPRELAALIATDTRRWEPVIKSIGFRAEE